MQQSINIIPTAVKPIMKPVSLAFNSFYSDFKLSVSVVVVALVYTTVVESYDFLIVLGVSMVEVLVFLVYDEEDVAYYDDDGPDYDYEDYYVCEDLDYEEDEDDPTMFIDWQELLHMLRQQVKELIQSDNPSLTVHDSPLFFLINDSLH